MIRGKVRDNEAIIRLRVFGPDAREIEIEAVLDTGYTASLTLPPSLIQSLRLVKTSAARGILGDGSEFQYQIFRAEIDWDGVRIELEIDEADTEPLLGMQLLHGYEVKLQVRHNGKLTIKKLAR